MPTVSNPAMLAPDQAPDPTRAAGADIGLIAKLVVIMLIALTPSLALEIYSEARAHATRLQLARDEGLRLLHQIQSEQQRLLDGARQVMNVIANAPAVRAQSTADCQKLLDNLLKEEPRYLWADVSGLDGTCICGPGPVNQPLNASDRWYFRHTLQTGGFTVGEYAVGKVTGKPTLHLAKPFRDQNGVIAGVVMAGLSLEWMNEQLAKIDLPPGAIVTIRDHNGVIMARKPDGMRFIGRSLSPDRGFLIKGDQIQTYDGLPALDTGRPKLVTFSPPGADPNGLTFVVLLDEEAIFSALTRSDGIGVSLIAGSLLLAVAATAIFGHRLIRRPVNELIDVAAKWRTGVLSARTTLRHRHDEFGLLGHAFEDMAEALDKRARDLRASEARFHTIFDTQFQNIALLALDGSTREANRSIIETIGLTRDELIGAKLWEGERWRDADRDVLKTQVAEVASGATFRREFEVLSVSGQIRRIDLSLRPIRDPVSGEVTSILMESRDMTKNYDLMLQLAQTHKLRALGQLAGGIAHDFNNILQIISGSAEIIEKDTRDDGRCSRYTQGILATCERGSSITGRLLSFARRGELRAEAIDIAQVLNNVREVLARTLDARIAIRIDAGDVIRPLFADRGQLETALINLATNARDAMPDGGELVLSADVEHVAEGDQHQADLTPGDYARIGVTDNGAGMDAATLARITEPFFTTKPVGQGTGLGLPMVKGFAEQSGGGMAVISSPGAGTTVAMWLPLAKSLDLCAIRDNRAASQPVSGSLTVLLVDDEAGLREMMAKVLETEGLTLRTAASGEEALSMIEAGAAVGVMVSDFAMPGLNGVKTIHKALQLRPRLPCILLTGYSGEEGALAADNGYKVLRKPIAGRALARTIAACARGVRSETA